MNCKIPENRSIFKRLPFKKMRDINSINKQIREIDDIIAWGTILGPFIVLITFSPINFDSFGLPKLTALYLVTLFLIYFQVRKWIVSGKARIPFESIHLLSVVVVLIAVVTTLTSANPLESVFGTFSRYESLIALMCYAAIMWFSFKSAREKDFKHYFEIVFIPAFLIISIYGVLEILGLVVSNPSFLAEGRISSTFGNPVFFGAFLSMALPILLAKAFYLPRKSKRIWDKPIIIFILICLGIAMLFSTLSRGAWLGTLIGFLVILYLKNKDKSKVKNKVKNRGKERASRLALPWMVIIFLGVVLGTLLVLGLTNIATPHMFNAVKSAGSLDSRVEIWKSALPLISKRPLFGYGLDQTKDWLSLYNTSRLARLENAIHDRAHNIYIQFAINGGILLLLAQIWMFVYAILKGIKTAKNSDNYMAVGFIGAITGYLAQGVTGIVTNESSAFLWFIMGAVAGFAATENLRTVSFNVPGKAALKRIVMPAFLLISLSAIYPVLVEARYSTLAKEASSTMSESALYSAYEANKYCIRQPFYKEHFAQICLSYVSSKEDVHFIRLAIKPLSDELRYYPDDLKLLEALGASHLVAAQFSKDKNDLYLAGKYLRHARDRSPKFLEVYTILFELYVLEGNYREAITCAKEMNAIDDKNPGSRVVAAISYKLKGDSKKADLLLREIDESDPKVKALKKRLLEDIKN